MLCSQARHLCTAQLLLLLPWSVLVPDLLVLRSYLARAQPGAALPGCPARAGLPGAGPRAEAAGAGARRAGRTAPGLRPRLPSAKNEGRRLMALFFTNVRS